MSGAGKSAVWLTIVMGCFAMIWMFWGTASLPGQGAIYAVGAALVISAVIALVVIPRALNIPDSPASAPPNMKLFWGAVVFEIVAAGTSIDLLAQFGESRFWLPVLALIIGIHFFGTGAAFHMSLQHWVGAAMCFVALISLIWLPPQHLTETGRVNVCYLVVGVGCAVILWSFVLISTFAPRIARG